MKDRASLYVRLSHYVNPSNTSKAGMIADLRRLCAEQDLQEVALHVDEGISGDVRDRPAFLAWLADAREGRADVLVSWHVDRMTREGVSAAAMIMDVIDGKDSVTGKRVHRPVRLIDVSGQDSSTGDAFRLPFVIAAEIARAERERIRARVRASRRRLVEAHRFPGGVVPYGYRSAPREGGGCVLEIDPEEAAHVRAAVDVVLSGGTAYAAMQALNAAGSRPRRAERWTLTSVLSMLRGDAILGRVRRGGLLLRADDGTPLQVWPAIISASEAQQLRARLAPRAGERQRNRRAARLLSGLLSCATCGGTLRVTVTGGKYPQTRYACYGNTEGRGCSRRVAVSADRIDDYVAGEFLRTVGDLQWSELRERMPDVDVSEIEQAIRDTTRALAESDADDGALFEQLRALKARRAAAGRARPRPVFEAVTTGETYRERWEASDVGGRRGMLAQDLDGPIVVRPGIQGAPFDPARVALRWTWED